jgi:hypothetical protein
MNKSKHGSIIISALAEENERAGGVKEWYEEKGYSEDDIEAILCYYEKHPLPEGVNPLALISMGIQLGYYLHEQIKPKE